MKTIKVTRTGNVEKILDASARLDAGFISERKFELIKKSVLLKIRVEKILLIPIENMKRTIISLRMLRNRMRVQKIINASERLDAGKITVEEFVTIKKSVIESFSKNKIM